MGEWSQFVFSQHCKAMRSAGFTEEQVQAIPFGAGASCWSPIERAVLAYTDCLVYDGGRVPDAVFDALKAELSDEQILYLTYITALYDMHAVMSKALRDGVRRSRRADRRDRWWFVEGE